MNWIQVVPVFFVSEVCRKEAITNGHLFVQRIPKTGKREAGSGKWQLVIFGGKTFAHDTPAVAKLFETCNMAYL